MEKQCYQSTEVNFGIFNNAQNTTVNGGDFSVAGRDVNMYKTYHYLSSNEEKKIQDWLAAPDCFTNYSTTLNKQVAGTGQWILKEPAYLQWKEIGGILWIQGQAGSGKTFLITGVIEHFRKASFPTFMIYHYFDICDNSEAKTTFQGLLLSFLLQLGAQDQNIHPALKNLHEASKSGLLHFQPTNTELVNTLIEITKDLVQKGYQIHIMIDALDECKEEEEVWNFCVKMTSLTSIGIMITSRYKS
ncbi:hypothetical protein F5878DRAFT_263562 [Lentinula raphanica]|uniref:NACHT domain-containing protein n=1 Tax=Lentinula raphanica TaxID=153919 RepID=A0AA38PIK2_9AGAR|nr:hypothetical protein F5878DRAFT_263562 [Lentinula raphanica]